MLLLLFVLLLRLPEFKCLNAVKQVVQEYERAVIFRLGRLLPGGAKGPGQQSLSILHIYNVYFISTPRRCVGKVISGNCGFMCVSVHVFPRYKRKTI